jgi:hypothetical protein
LDAIKDVLRAQVLYGLKMELPQEVVRARLRNQIKGAKEFLKSTEAEYRLKEEIKKAAAVPGAGARKL